HAFDLLVRAKLSRDLLRFPNRHRPALRVGLVDHAEVHRANVGLVVIEKADEAEVRLEIGLDLFDPLSAKSSEEIAVARVDVPSDADRITVVKAGVGSGPSSAHEEIVQPVAQDQVGNDLLPGWVTLHPRPWLEPAGCRVDV